MTITPNTAMTEAIAETLESFDRVTGNDLQEVVAALGQAAARVMAAAAQTDSDLREMLAWFGEHVERDALRSYHRYNEPEEFR